MKGFLYRALFCFAIVTVVSVSEAIGQCDQELIDICSGQIGESTYIKHFKIRFGVSKSAKKPSTATFSVILNKGTQYRFTTCNDAGKQGQTVLELADDFTVYGTNYDPATKKVYKSIDFQCNKTSPYYITMYFADGLEGCGVCMMSLVGMIKNN